MGKREDKAINIIINLILVGVGCITLGAVLSIVLQQAYLGRLGLFGSILYTLASGYAAMYLGIALYSFIQFRQMLTTAQILRVYYFTFPALLVTLYLFIFSNWEWGWYLGCLSLLYSIIGLILGFSRTISSSNINRY